MGFCRKGSAETGRISMLRRSFGASIRRIFVPASKRSGSRVQDSKAGRIPDGFLLSHPLDLFPHVSDSQLHLTPRMPHISDSETYSMSSNGNHIQFHQPTQVVFRWRFSFTRDFSVSHLSIEAPCWFYRIMQRLVLGIRWRRLDEKKQRKTIGH